MGDPLPRTHDFRLQPLPEAMRVAIVGLRNRQERLHLGILFRDEGELRHLHLKWHHKVRSEPASRIRDEEKLFWIDLGLDETEEEYLIGRFRAIARQNQGSYSIAYGFRHEQGRFAADGNFAPGQDCGLTCATFVLAAFESGEHSLVDIHQWPMRSEDTPFQEKMLKALREDRDFARLHPDFERYVQKLELEVRCPRFRPEEVAAAGTAPEHPADFKYCEQWGRAFVKHFLPQQQ